MGSDERVRKREDDDNDSSSDNDVPLAQRMATLPVPEAPAAKKKAVPKQSLKAIQHGSTSGRTETLIAKKKQKKLKDRESTKLAKKATKTTAKKKIKKSGEFDRGLHEREDRQISLFLTPYPSLRPASIAAAIKARKKTKARKVVHGKDQKKQMWTTLQHAGVIFPPEYKPHNVKMLYDGKAVDLTPAQEEVMTTYAMMRETEYLKKATFVKNAWNAMKKVLGKDHTIKTLEKCDFTPIWEWHLAEKEKKKQTTKEEKKKIKEEKEVAEAKYKFCQVDDRREQVGNFRVEPPGLFRGRGEHPKMGMWKRRVYPEEVTINIGEDAEVPECPIPGHRWGRVQHDHTVTWLGKSTTTTSPSLSLSLSLSLGCAMLTHPRFPFTFSCPPAAFSLLERPHQRQGRQVRFPCREQSVQGSV